MNLIPCPPRFEYRFPRPYRRRDWPTEGQDSILTFVQADAKRQVGMQNLGYVHLREEAYSALACTMFKRVRVAAGVLPGNLRNIYSQDLPSFFHARKRCSSGASSSLNGRARSRSNIRHRHC
jgi:hypothetical protein